MRVKDWEIIADNLSTAGWSWGYVSAVDIKVLLDHVMARAYPIYEARAKVSEIPRRVTAAETSLCHFRIIK